MIEPFGGKKPRIHKTVFVHPTATIIGDVVIGRHSSVWPGAVIRGDFGYVKIGKYTNVQDNAVIHSGDIYTEKGPVYVPTKIGDYVTIGHNALVHGATVDDLCIIGGGSSVFTGAKVRRGSMVGLGATVLRDSEVPPRTIVVGIPARPLRSITSEEFKKIRAQAQNYAKLCRKYLKEASKSSRAGRRWGTLLRKRT
jgi:carbonic anhydrase/acetyltransferase-like protein (isoleucine patch superfamily)